MIDTNVLVLNNLEKYPDLLRFFLKNAKHRVKEGDVEFDMSVPDRKVFLQVKEYHHKFSDGDKRTVWATGSVLTSSHYNLGFRLPLGEQAPWVEMNFSIPKLIYGTNILQFVQHKTERRPLRPFSLRFNNQVRYNAEQTYERYIHFLERFFYRLNGFKHIDFRDLQIKRLDFCQVQMFHSREDALTYIKYQGDKVKKWSRKDSNKPRSYGTTVFFNTRDYGAKIYHKGDEYKSSTGEKQEHKKVNRRAGTKVDGIWREANIFDTNKLQEWSDKMLRYEITFRNSAMSKIYRDKVWRKDSSWHQGQMKRYAMLKRIYQYSTSKIEGEKGSEKYKKQLERANHYVDLWNGYKLVTHYCPTCHDARKKDSSYLNEMCRACWYEKLPVSYRQKDGSLYTIKKEDRDFYFWWTKKKNKAVEFYFDVDEATKQIESGEVVLYDTNDGMDCAPDHARFSKALFMEMYKVFMAFKDEFRIERTSTFTEAQVKAGRFNERAEAHNTSKVNIQKLKQLFALRQQYSWEQIVNYGFASRETVWRYKQRLKNCDLNFDEGTPTAIKNDRTFEWYHRALLLDRELNRYTDNSYFN